MLSISLSEKPRKQKTDSVLIYFYFRFDVVLTLLVFFNSYLSENLFFLFNIYTCIYEGQSKITNFFCSFNIRRYIFENA